MLDTVACACNLSTREVEAGGSVQCHLHLQSELEASLGYPKTLSSINQQTKAGELDTKFVLCVTSLEFPQGDILYWTIH